MQLNFLDNESALTPEAAAAFKGKAVKQEPVKGPRAKPGEFKPDEKTAWTYRNEIREALEIAGDVGVSGERMREICPQSATQRISEVRRGYEAESPPRTVRCQKVGDRGSLYFLEPLKTETDK